MSTSAFLENQVAELFTTCSNPAELLKKWSLMVPLLEDFLDSRSFGAAEAVSKSHPLGKNSLRRRALLRLPKDSRSHVFFDEVPHRLCHGPVFHDLLERYSAVRVLDASALDNFQPWSQMNRGGDRGTLNKLLHLVISEPPLHLRVIRVPEGYASTVRAWVSQNGVSVEPALDPVVERLMAAGFCYEALHARYMLQSHPKHKVMDYGVDAESHSVTLVDIYDTNKALYYRVEVKTPDETFTIDYREGGQFDDCGFFEDFWYDPDVQDLVPEDDNDITFTYGNPNFDEFMRRCLEKIIGPRRGLFELAERVPHEASFEDCWRRIAFEQDRRKNAFEQILTYVSFDIHHVRITSTSGDSWVN